MEPGQGAGTIPLGACVLEWGAGVRAPGHCTQTHKALVPTAPDSLPLLLVSQGGRSAVSPLGPRPPSAPLPTLCGFHEAQAAGGYPGLPYRRGDVGVSR